MLVAQALTAQIIGLAIEVHRHTAILPVHEARLHTSVSISGSVSMSGNHVGLILNKRGPSDRRPAASCVTARDLGCEVNAASHLPRKLRFLCGKQASREQYLRRRASRRRRIHAVSEGP
jgi:hypothetical protein